MCKVKNVRQVYMTLMEILVFVSLFGDEVVKPFFLILMNTEDKMTMIKTMTFDPLQVDQTLRTVYGHGCSQC